MNPYEIMKELPPGKVARNRLEKGDWIRASGDCICPVCGFEYRDHPRVPGFPWLHIICNNDWVKL